MCLNPHKVSVDISLVTCYGAPVLVSSRDCGCESPMKLTGVSVTKSLDGQNPLASGSNPSSVEPPKVLVDLVEKFHLHRDQYKKGPYNETELRRDFIDPMFGALGWDISNQFMYAEAYRDVIHEDAIQIEGERKAPDYCFRVGGTRKFFLETKRPSVNIKEDRRPAFQLRRYGWSAKLPVSILTDFEEFAIYDCRFMPNQDDVASTARLYYTTYEKYLSEWGHISSIFGKEAVLKGAFDKFAITSRQKRGTVEVDDAFLSEIESWREILAKSLVYHNPKLADVREINHAVQVTIDRIVFLRMCEDRAIEPYGQLSSLTKKPGIYRRMLRLFEKADERYNSGLFHFQKEKGRHGEIDLLTPKLNIDDSSLQRIIDGIYYPASPYEFSVISADILGQVYERFLGKIITVTPSRGVRIDDKPDRRKDEGVYYTPSFVVDYLVKRTLDAVLVGKTSKQADSIRVLDPACGSGSFLLGAYQYLVNWYCLQYVKEADTKRGVVFEMAPGHWHLSTAEKRRILLNSIFGVDIDPQAVEVTKLSLLLKVLEGESSETLERQKRFFHDRALPDLDNNIKCGNALIGPDFYDQETRGDLSQEDHYRINVFDWNARFPWIEEEGGFDVVIGNPPYLSIDDTWGKGDIKQRYIKQSYPNIHNDKSDILFYFFAKAVELSRAEVCFIVSRAFLEAFKADKLRAWLADRTNVREIIDFRNHYVFQGVGITTAIVSLTKSQPVATAEFRRLAGPLGTSIDLATIKEDRSVFQSITVEQASFGGGPWLFAEGNVDSVLKKIDASGDPLSSFLAIGQGMQTGCNTVFGGLKDTDLRRWKVGKAERFMRARNSDIQRYLIQDSEKHLLYLEDVSEFDQLPEGIRQHLLSSEAELKGRAAYQRGNCQWWRYTWPLHKDHLRRPKIFCPYMATRNRFALDNHNKYLGLTDTTMIFDSDQREDLRYLLALLNSRLLTFRFLYIGKLKGNGILEYFENTVSKLPIRRIDLTNAAEKTTHDELVGAVEKITSLYTQIAKGKTEHQNSIIQHQIDAVDRQIDRLVYSLYGLDAGEIAIVEQELRAHSV